MSLLPAPRASLRPSVGLLVLLLATATPAGEPVEGRRGLLTGRVAGLGEKGAARVELRLLVELPGPEAYAWERPYSHCSDPRDLERWLRRGVSTREPLAVTTVRGRNAGYRFEGLAPGVYELRLVAGSRVVTTASAQVQVDGQHAARDLDLVRGTLTLRVRLRTPGGAAFRGFVIAAQKECGLLARPHLEGALEAATDTSGLVEFAGLYPGPCELTALHPGSLRVRRTPIDLPHDLPHDGVLEWTIEPGPVLSGKLVRSEDSTPVSGATVYAHRSGRPKAAFAVARGRSDATGRFTLPVGGAGTELLIIAPGRAPGWLELADDEDVGTVRLAASARVGGWVRGPDGRPAADVFVRAEPAWSLSPERPALTTRTDASGRYAFNDLPPGEVRLYARGDALLSPQLEDGWWGGFDPLARELRPGERARVDLQTVPALRLRGRVLDARGAPVAGALVRRSPWSDGGSAVATDAEGRFEFRGLLPGATHDLYASAPGQVEARRVDVAAGTDGADVELRFVEGSGVLVEVLAGREADPVARARVRMYQDSGSRTDIRRLHAPDTWTDARGRAFVGPLPRGPAVVQVTAPGFGDRMRSVVVGAEGITRVTMTRETEAAEPGEPLARPFTIRGHVLPPPGVPLGSVDLRVSGPDELLVGEWAGDGGRAVEVAASGAFEARVGRQARYGLRARMHHEGRVYWSQVSAVAGASRIEIPLRPAPWLEETAGLSTWRFRIVDGEGAPVPAGAAFGETQARDGSSSDRHGYQLGRLAVTTQKHRGPTTWYFRDAVDACGLWLPLGPRIVGPLLPDERPSEVVLPPEHVIRGNVTGPDGGPVQGVRVHARRLGPGVADAGFNERTALVGADGRFRLGGLGEGPNVLRLDVPRSMARVERLLLEHDMDHDEVNIALHAAVAPRVRVVGPKGEVLAKAEVEIQPDNDDFWTFDDNVVIEGFYSGPGYVTERTDAEGGVSFARLDPQRGYVLWVRPPDDRHDLAPLYLSGWKPRTAQAFQLAPWADVRGLVRDASGTPVEGASVFARQAGQWGWERSVETDAQGRFVFDRLRPGPVRLVVSADGDEPEGESPSGMLHTKAGAHDVVLVTDR